MQTTCERINMHHSLSAESIAHLRSIKHVGRVRHATQARLKDGPFHLLVRKVPHGDGGQHLKERRCIAASSTCIRNSAFVMLYQTR